MDKVSYGFELILSERRKMVRIASLRVRGCLSTSDVLLSAKSLELYRIQLATKVADCSVLL